MKRPFQIFTGLESDSDEYVPKQVHMYPGRYPKLLGDQRALSPYEQMYSLAFTLGQQSQGLRGKKIPRTKKATL